ncbi:hypothetical protein SOVF_012540 [Spinacia oleracea]|nr:hypothetical protein SOVF_012540 [Spinacia oleracea]
MTDAFFNNASMLMILDLGNNDLSGHIPAEIENLINLEVLVLRGNQFHGQVPVQLCKLLTLSILDLSSNSLYGSIPTCLGEIAFSGDIIAAPPLSSSEPGSRQTGKLAELIEERKYKSFEYEFSNKVQFTTKSQSYLYIGSAMYLMSGIDLSCNNITGQIPRELGNLSTLHALNLSHNKLWGAIPTTLSNLKNIESLDFSYNLLNGSIPPALTTLNAIEVFMVAYNNLSGRIPYEVQFSTFDTNSYQGNFFLCGPPISKNCTADKSPSYISKTASYKDEDGDWIDMESFYMTFVISGVTMFLAVVIVMLINPQWRNALFYLVKTCIISSYYYFEDNMRKLLRVRRV